VSCARPIVDNQSGFGKRLDIKALGGQAVELQAGQAGIKAALGGERAVVAFLDDAAMVHVDDPVGGADGGNA